MKPDQTEMPSTSEASLRSLRRLHQLASEIRRAVHSGDLSVIAQASRLLAPALEQCRAQGAQTTPEGLALVQETAALLRECETVLITSMQNVETQLRHMRRGRRTLVARRPPAAPMGRRLDSRE